MKYDVTKFVEAIIAILLLQNDGAYTICTKQRGLEVAGKCVPDVAVEEE